MNAVVKVHNEGERRGDEDWLLLGGSLTAAHSVDARDGTMDARDGTMACASGSSADPDFESLTTFYAKHAPDKANSGNVAAILEKYQGKVLALAFTLLSPLRT